MDPQAHAALLREGGALVAIFGAAHRTAKNNLEKRQSEKRQARAKNSAARLDPPITRSPDLYPMICAIVSGCVRMVILCRALVM